MIIIIMSIYMYGYKIIIQDDANINELFLLLIII